MDNGAENSSAESNDAEGHAPAISVVIPTYNRAHLVGRAVRSVLAQSFEDFELIVADDASTDDTAAVVEAFGDPRVRYVRRAENGGNAAARNTGVKHARAEVVCFLDSDDEYFPSFLEKTHRALSAAGASVGFSWAGRLTVRSAAGRAQGEEVVGRDLWMPRIEGDRQLHFLSSRHTGTDFGLAVRRRCFEEVGFFDEELRASVDSDFLIRIAKAFDFTVVPEVLVKAHDHDGARVRRDTRSTAAAYEAMFEKHAALLHSHPEVASRWLYKTGWLHHHCGDRAKGNAYLWRSIKKDPSKAKVWLALLLFGIGGAAAAPLHERLSRLKETFRSQTPALFRARGAEEDEPPRA